MDEARIRAHNKIAMAFCRIDAAIDLLFKCTDAKQDYWTQFLFIRKDYMKRLQAALMVHPLHKKLYRLMNDKAYRGFVIATEEEIAKEDFQLFDSFNEFLAVLLFMEAASVNCRDKLVTNGYGCAGKGLSRILISKNHLALVEDISVLRHNCELDYRISEHREFQGELNSNGFNEKALSIRLGKPWLCPACHALYVFSDGDAQFLHSLYRQQIGGSA